MIRKTLRSLRALLAGTLAVAAMGAALLAVLVDEEAADRVIGKLEGACDPR